MEKRAAQIATLLLTGAGALALAACDGGGGDEATVSSPRVGVMLEAAGNAAPAKMADMAQPAPTPGSEPAAPEPGETAGAMLAYSYSMGIEAPKAAVPALKDAHEKACMEAGPKQCQVLGSSVNSWGEDSVYASLNLRAAPDWLAGFRETITADAGEAGGRVTADNVNTEDLTAYMVDLDARLEAKLALRDRIRQLLETRDGDLSDVLAAERALADVQGEIDSMTAQLAAARARVDMSALSISYQSDPETSTGVFKPLVEAFKDFFRTSVASLASAVNFVARAWPFFLIGLGVLFILRAWWRGRRAKA